MSPPGRRRRDMRQIPHFTLLLACLFLFLTTRVQAASAVLGIDIGQEYIKAAIVKPGSPLDIVLTKDSKRKESAAIAFKPATADVQNSTSFPERLYGGDALALGPRFPSDVFPNLKPLLGSLVDRKDAVQEYKKRYPALDLLEDGDTVAFRSTSLHSEQGTFTVEEMLAMELKAIKANAEIMTGKGSTIRDVVITVPSFYTVDERRAVELAGSLAGFKVMGLISDGMAVGLHYATSRTFPNVNKGEKAEHHLVYDMGAGSTTATVLRFQAREVKDVGKRNKTIQEVTALGTGWDRSLGGDALNWLIVNDMVFQFLGSSAAKSGNVQEKALRSHGRTMAKLWREAERARQVLSANAQTNAFFEGLYEDIDFRYKIQRTEFEALAAEYATRVETPFSAALAAAKLELSDLDSVVIHGGATRTPFVQKQLESLAGGPAKLRSNVNADEAAVFGAAFRAAGLSPNFRVKDIQSNDLAQYAVTMRWNLNGKDRKTNIFIPTSQIGAAKQIPFNTVDDFSFAFSQQIVQHGTEDLVERPISTAKITNLTSTVTELTTNRGCIKEEIKTAVTIRLDPLNGYPEIVKATATCEGREVEKKGTLDGVKDFLGFGKKDGQTPLGDEDGDAEEISLETSSVATSSTSDALPSPSSAAADSKKNETAAKAPKKKIEVINLNFELERADSKQQNAEGLLVMNDRLSAFDRSDKGRRLREELFNSLESFSYKTRDMLTDESFIAVSTEMQRAEIEKQLKMSSEWMSGDGANAGLEEVKDRLKALRDLVNPVQKRKTEQTNRPKAVEDLQNSLIQAKTMVSVVQKHVEDAAASSAALPSSSSTSADDLGDDETSTLSSVRPTPTPELGPYSDADLAEISAIHDSIHDWLNGRIESQNALAAFDEPAFSSAELEQSTDALNQVMSRLMRKKTNYDEQQKASSRSSSSSSSSSSSKSKAKKSKTSTSSTEETDTSATESPEAEPTDKDEL